MGLVEVKVPKLGLTMTSAKVIKVLKNVGDAVSKDEVVAEIETEKLTTEVKSPVDGVVKEVMVKEGDEVGVGETLLVIETNEGVGPSSEEVVEEGAEGGKVKASPAARYLASKYGVDLKVVKGSGPAGVILREDVINYLRSEGLITESPTEVREGLTPSIAKEVKLSPMRLRIAENLSRSWREAVITTVTMEVKVDDLVRIRESIPKDVRPSVTAFIVKAVAAALKEYPELNSSLVGDRLRIYRDINIAVAVATHDGLITPVIRGADRKSIQEISREIKELAGRARRGDLGVDDVKGSTFTVSNLGMYGVDVFTPIPQPNQVAVLGVGRIYDKLYLSSEGLRVGKYLVLSLSFDHRVIDGAKAAEFLGRVKELLENPYLMLLSK